MAKYEVSFTHLIERYVTCVVEADSEEEAIAKAKDGEYIDSDEELCPEQGIETSNYEIAGEVD